MNKDMSPIIIRNPDKILFTSLYDFLFKLYEQGGNAKTADVAYITQTQLIKYFNLK